jgi:hypothetical protein
MARTLLNQLRWEVTVSNPSANGNTVSWSNTTGVFCGIEASFAGQEGPTAGQTTGTVQYTLLFRDEISVTANSIVHWVSNPSAKPIRVQAVRMAAPGYIAALGIETQ